MLSRVAERIYWTARYLERIENTARLVVVYSGLLLDLPKGSRIGWAQLVDIIGGSERFNETHAEPQERNTLQFILADQKNPGSVLTALAMARENMRITRDIVPGEAWEHVNELHHFARKHARSGVGRRTRFDFLSELISRCQLITGMLAGTMSHGDPYRFLRIGRNLERADMTTRIVDVGTASVMAGGDKAIQTDATLWRHVLDSLSAEQMYRQKVRRRIAGREVLSFLIQDTEFPRAVDHCLEQLDMSLAPLPGSESVLRGVARLRRHVAETDLAGMEPSEVHALMDSLQMELAAIHDLVAETWFLPVATA